MKSFQRQKETAPTTSGGRCRKILLWAFLGAALGFMGYHPLAILMAGNTKAMIGTFEDWTLPAFVPLSALACAAIPFATMLRLSSARAEGWSRMLRGSLILAAFALPVASVLAIILFGAVRSSWQYEHDGVADWFMLSIPVATAVAVVVSALLMRNHAVSQ